MKAILISDLHLDEARPDITEKFQVFLKEKVLGQNLDQFFILGDFFEVWIGDDYSNALVESVKADLKKVSEEVPECFIQHGNRDFLIGEQFCKDTGFQLLGEIHEFNISNDNKDLKIAVMHGDSLCTRDVEYMKVREFLRSDLFVNDVLSKSIQERLVLADQLRGASKEANSEKTMDIMDVTEEEVAKLMEEKSIDILIHGHTHRPAVHPLQLKHQQQAKRVVMSDWEQSVQFVEIAKGEVNLLSF